MLLNRVLKLKLWITILGLTALSSAKESFGLSVLRLYCIVLYKAGEGLTFCAAKTEVFSLLGFTVLIQETKSIKSFHSSSS